MQVQVDYRNAKYQGSTDQQGRRQGFGILIDDDLSFYVSDWNSGKLEGPTLIYIHHGKYIYGQWRNNEPHGLNVFRIGDTVILSEFEGGRLVGRILVIFERANFMAVIQGQADQEWVVVESGELRAYEGLLQFIEKAQLPVKSHHFCLARFLSYISRERIRVSSESCYFGFESGLGIIFNKNNGVESVGVHEGRIICEFGGKYEGQTSVEGNFETGELVEFNNDRPVHRIYSVFQKMHKRSLNFKNEYYDSKVKLLTRVEELIRGKIHDILSQREAQQKSLSALDLNDSLDYHSNGGEQMKKIREEVYEPKPNQRKSRYIELKEKGVPPSPKKIYAPQSPLKPKKSPSKLSSKLKSGKSVLKCEKSKSTKKISEKIERRIKLMKEDEGRQYLSKQCLQTKEIQQVPEFQYHHQQFETVIIRKKHEFSRQPSLFDYPDSNTTESHKQDSHDRKNRILREYQQLNPVMNEAEGDGKTGDHSPSLYRRVQGMENSVPAENNFQPNLTPSKKRRYQYCFD